MFTRGLAPLKGRVVNNHGGFGRRGFIEILDPWDAANEIRKLIVER